MTAANTAPVANAQTVSTNEDTAKTITLGGSDADGNNLTFAIGTGPTHGSLGTIGSVTCTGTAPKSCSADVTYTPALNYNGSDSFTFKVNDGTVDSAAATVSITVNAVNDAPTCSNGSATTAEDNAVATALSCADIDSATLTYSIVSGPAHGSLSGTGASRTYTPDANYSGSDSFTYKASDGSLDSNTATVSVTITAVNDAPTCSNGSATTAEDNAVATALSCADIDSATLTYSIVSGPAHGSLSGTGASRTYTPDANYNGSDSFTFKASDGSLDSNTATFSLTITEVNDAPTAVADSKTIAEDGVLSFPASDLTANDSAGPANESGQTLTVISVDPIVGDTHGSVSLVAGTVTYTPDADFNGLAKFNYTVQDNGTTNGAPDFKTGTVYVNVTVTEVNDAPDALNDSDTVAEDGNVLVDVLANDSTGPANESGQTLTITAVSTPAHGTAVVQSGKVKYTPDADYNGTDSFTYTATDNGTTNGVADPQSDTATVSVTVTEVNDAPDALNDSDTVAEDGNVLVDVLANDSTGPANESGQTLTITAVSTPAHGTAVVQSGKVKYTPDADYNGTDSFTYTATDNGTTNGIADPQSDTATVSVTVTEVNDAPDALNDSDTVAEDGNVLVDVLANDSTGPANESGQTLTITAVSTPAHGTAVVQSGKVKYTPDADYNGTRLLHLHGHRQRHHQRRQRLQVRHRHGLRDRVRGQRCTRLRSTTRRRSPRTGCSASRPPT